MIRLYKDVFAGYILGVIAGIILAVLLIVNDVNIFATYLLEFVWLFSFRSICYGISVKRVNRLVAVMNQECQVQEFLRQMICLQENAKGKVMKLYFAVNLAAGYLNLGDVDTAFYYLQNINTDRLNFRGKDRLLITYYYNFSVACMMKEDWEGANAMLSRMRSLLDSVKLKPVEKEAYEGFYRIKCIRMQALQGNYDGAENACMEALEQSESLLRQVSLIYFLRDIFLHEGRWQEAEKCRELIRENGGDTYYVAKVG